MAPPAWGARAKPGPAERPYSVLKPIIRTEWDVGDDETAWCLAEQGQLQLAVQLCEAIEADGVSKGLLTTRSAGLLRLPVTVTGDEELVQLLTGPTENIQTARGGLLWRMFPMATLARLIRFGVLLGAGVGYFVQGDDDPCPVLHAVEHQFLVTRRDSTGHARLYYRTLDGEVEVTPGDGRWFVYAPYGIDRFWLYGAWRAVGKFWLAKNAAVDQRTTWGAKLARGILWITAPNSSTTEERDDIVQFIAAAIAPPVISMLQGWELNNIDVQGHGFEVWRDGKDDANAEIAMALSGQLVTSGIESVGFGEGNIHKDIAQSFIDADAEALAEALHFYGLEPWADAMGLEGPWAEWDTTPPEDKKTISESAKVAGDGLKALAEGLAAIGSDVKVDVPVYLGKAGVEVVEPDETQEPLDATTVSGIDVAIEYPDGSIRRGKDENGEPWATLMVGAGYGEIVGSGGADGEPVDAYVGPLRAAQTAYVLEQLTSTGERDEFKVFLGFSSLEHAQQTYRRLGRADLEGTWAEVPAALLAELLRGAPAPANDGALPALPEAA